jgi:hypothetical protein
MLNAALIIGLCASFLNLGDLLLRPHQKRAFEEYFGALVLWLDYKRLLHWFSRLDKPSRTYILTTGMILVLCGLVALTSDRLLFESLAVVALLLALSFLQCAWFWERWWMNEGFRYVVGDGTAKTFAVRLAWIPLATLLYTIIAGVASQFWFGLVAVLAFTLWVLIDHPRVYWAAMGALVSRSWWKRKKGVRIRRVEPQLTPAWRRVPEDDAMETDSRSGWQGKGALEDLMRERIGPRSKPSSKKNWRPRWVRQSHNGWVRSAPAIGTASAPAG